MKQCIFFLTLVAMFFCMGTFASAETIIFKGNKLTGSLSENSRVTLKKLAKMVNKGGEVTIVNDLTGEKIKTEYDSFYLPVDRGFLSVLVNKIKLYLEFIEKEGRVIEKYGTEIKHIDLDTRALYLDKYTLFFVPDSELCKRK